jgi:hypothetical protein
MELSSNWSESPMLAEDVYKLPHFPSKSILRSLSPGKDKFSFIAANKLGSRIDSSKLQPLLSAPMVTAFGHEEDSVFRIVREEVVSRRSPQWLPWILDLSEFTASTEAEVDETQLSNFSNTTFRILPRSTYQPETSESVVVEHCLEEARGIVWVRV